MSLFDDLIYRQNQKKANNFIESLKSKNENDIEQAYLDNKEFQNNEAVLSYIFFNHPELIRILPLEFQKSRINSNLKMFSYGSEDARKELVSSWLKDNKFFMNALVVGFTEVEYENYIQLYFKQPDDVALLFMDDLKRVIKILSDKDLKKTEELLEKIKPKLTDRQWEYIIGVKSSLIKYAPPSVQSAHSEEEEFIKYLSGDARNKYVSLQAELIESDFSKINEMDADIQVKYIKDHPYMMNYLDIETMVNVLNYDNDLIKYANFNIRKDKEDMTQEVVCKLLEKIENKSNKEIVNILVSKCLLNAKGKLYRFDPNSNDISYQYTRRIIRTLQNLTINQIVTLVMIDVNYILPYIVPVYKDETPIEEKKKITIDCNSRCLNVFKAYYGEPIYSKYYKTINKIYSAFMENIEKYDFSKDYRCIFDLFKVLFNKPIIKNNTYDKVSLFIGTSIFYKDNTQKDAKINCITLLNELLENAYKVKINNNKELYNIGSLELFDPKLDFISRDLLNDFSKYNFVNISNLLLIIKSDKIYKLFKAYYEILIYVYGESKESLYKIIETFAYNKTIVSKAEETVLTSEQRDNIVILLTELSNSCKITKIEDLDKYNIILFKKLVSDLANVKDQDVYKNILCNYLFNRGYNEKGETGWLEIDTVKQLIDIYDAETLDSFEINGEKVFDEDEVALFRMTKLLFSIDDFDTLLGFVNNIITNNIKRNIISITELFNKIKKYKVELINNEIVSLKEIDDLYETTNDIVTKTEKDGLNLYKIVGQDFKVLCSTNDETYKFECVNVSDLEKNVYVFDRLTKDRPIRFVSEDDKTVVKTSKDAYGEENMKPNYILLVNEINDNIIEIAKSLNLDIVEVQR